MIRKEDAGHKVMSEKGKNLGRARGGRIVFHQGILRRRSLDRSGMR